METPTPDLNSTPSCNHKRCKRERAVNCIRGIKKPKFIPFDDKNHVWRKISTSSRPDGVQVIVEKCKKKGCVLWRWVSFDWKEIEGKATMVPTVQYMRIPEPSDLKSNVSDGKS